MERENSASFILFFIYFLKKKNKNMLHNKKGSIVQACKIKANLTSGRGLTVS
jgi:hypothetical protein